MCLFDNLSKIFLDIEYSDHVVTVVKVIFLIEVR